MRRRALALLLLALPAACTGGGALPEVTGPFAARPTIVFPPPAPSAGPPPADPPSGSPADPQVGAPAEPPVGSPGDSLGDSSARPPVAPRAGMPAGRAEVLIEGGGSEVGPADLAVVHYAAHVWDGGADRLADSTFARGVPTATLPPALSATLAGHRVGTRLLVTLPPAGSTPATAQPPPPRNTGPTGTGPGGSGGPGPGGVGLRGSGRGGTLLYVVDILGKHAAGASLEVGGGELDGVRVTGGPRPEVAVPVGPAPGRFGAVVLSRGRGAPVETGRLVVAQYEGVVWGSGRIAGSTWRAGRPAAFTVGDGSVIAGWDRALLGVPAGSRVLMVVPPADAYGTSGHPPLGVEPGDTLVYVMDILATY